MGTVASGTPELPLNQFKTHDIGPPVTPRPDAPAHTARMCRVGAEAPVGHPAAGMWGLVVGFGAQLGLGAHAGSGFDLGSVSKAGSGSLS